MRLILGLAACLALTACGKSQEEKDRQSAAEDARDIAMVEQAQEQKPPPVKIELETISTPEITEKKLWADGCNFAPNNSMGVIVLGQQHRALVKVHGDIIQLAADPGSAPDIHAFPRKFVGKEFVLTMTRDGAPLDRPTSSGPGSVTVLDPYDQTIYAAAGTVQCTS